MNGDAMHISSALLQHATEQLQRHSGSLNRELKVPCGTHEMYDTQVLTTPVAGAASLHAQLR